MAVRDFRSMRVQDFWQDHLQPFLVFSKGERNGVIFLFLLLNLAWIIPVYLPRKQVTLTAAELVLIDSARKSWDTVQAKDKRYRITENTAERDEGRWSPESPAKLLFRPFDPNTADEQTWLAMGIPLRTIRTIHRYIDRGGRFRSPEDVRKIYSLTDQQYRSLKAWIRIAPPPGRPGPKTGQFEERGPSPGSGPSYASKDAPAYRRAPVFRAPLDVNVADSAAWEALPGIGPTLARRIIRYREALGGFYRVEQVGETFGLPDSVFQRIRQRLTTGLDYPVRPVPVNRADPSVLAAHPYISRKLAGLIAAYRTRHGPFQAPEDLLAIPLFSDSLLNHLRPYLSFN
jgi:DNA uptake protein ComE-like DNA-binding protein